MGYRCKKGQKVRVISTPSGCRDFLGMIVTIKKPETNSGYANIVEDGGYTQWLDSYFEPIGSNTVVVLPPVGHASRDKVLKVLDDFGIKSRVEESLSSLFKDTKRAEVIRISHSGVATGGSLRSVLATVREGKDMQPYYHTDITPDRLAILYMHLAKPLTDQEIADKFGVDVDSLIIAE